MKAPQLLISSRVECTPFLSRGRERYGVSVQGKGGMGEALGQGLMEGMPGTGMGLTWGWGQGRGYFGWGGEISY